MFRSLLCLTLLATAPAHAAGPAGAPALPHTLPATMEHNRFFVHPQAPSGETLRLYTDTGGGTFITTGGADKLGIAYVAPESPTREPVGSTAWPAYEGAWIPRPESGGDAPDLPIMAPPPGFGDDDGLLGARWFGDRTWEWDYRAGTLRLLPDGALPEVASTHVVKLGFQEGENGAHTSHFPRIPVRIDGEELQMLFDTGAMFRLDEAAAERLGDAVVRERAGSFITRSVIERWHERHPDWPWIDEGDSGMAMIRVPDVEIAGYHTGPVWFSARPDRNFHEWIAQWMDQPLDGAIGGNAFDGFRITIDYAAETAVFEHWRGAPPVQ